MSFDNSRQEQRGGEAPRACSIEPGKGRRTLSVEMTPWRMRRLLPTVSAASNMGSCDSCRSLLYVAGRPLSVVRKPASCARSSRRQNACRTRKGRCARRNAGGSRREGAARTWPTVRPLLPRRSSHASGFFFCGMIDEPVLHGGTTCVSIFAIASDHSRLASCRDMNATQGAPVRIAADDPAKLARRVNDEVLGEARDVHHEERAREEVLGDEVAVGDRLWASA